MRDLAAMALVWLTEDRPAAWLVVFVLIGVGTVVGCFVLWIARLIGNS